MSFTYSQANAALWKFHLEPVLGQHRLITVDGVTLCDQPSLHDPAASTCWYNDTLMIQSFDHFAPWMLHIPPGRRLVTGLHHIVVSGDMLLSAAAYSEDCRQLIKDLYFIMADACCGLELTRTANGNLNITINEDRSWTPGAVTAVQQLIQCADSVYPIFCDVIISDLLCWRAHYQNVRTRRVNVQFVSPNHIYLPSDMMTMSQSDFIDACIALHLEQYL